MFISWQVRRASQERKAVLRVDYIMPALQPAIGNQSPAGPEIVPSFREQVRTQKIATPRGWEEQLRLDARPFTATYIGPPPRPNTLALDNFQTERVRWRNLVSHHDGGVDSPRPSGTSLSEPTVQSMILMLRQMQEMEDSIVAQQVAVTRG